MQKNFKGCCSAFYENDLIRVFFHDVLHPGGIELTRTLAQQTGVKGKKVLDLSCGTGETALFLAKEFSSQVTGIDLSEKNISLAKEKAKKEGITATFQKGDVETLAFENKSFDVILSECSLCLSDREKVLQEAFRVLKPGGRLGVTDFVTHSLPKEFQSLLFQVLCIANAPSVEELQKDIKQSGFVLQKTENLTNTLLHTIEILKKRLFLAEVSGVLGKIDLSQFGIKLEDGKQLIEKTRQYVEEGRIGYMMVVAEA